MIVCWVVLVRFLLVVLSCCFCLSPRVCLCLCVFCVVVSVRSPPHPEVAFVLTCFACVRLVCCSCVWSVLLCMEFGLFFFLGGGGLFSFFCVAGLLLFCLCACVFVAVVVGVCLFACVVYVF